MATFVLVHGAWHGGWCWRRVMDILTVHGHRVFAPSLTGVGDRAPLFSKDVSLLRRVCDFWCCGRTAGTRVSLRLFGRWSCARYVTRGIVQLVRLQHSRGARGTTEGRTRTGQRCGAPRTSAECFCCD